MLCGWISKRGFPEYENGMFGFDRTQRGFFQRLYEQTLRDVTIKHENGYGAYIDLINSELVGKGRIDTKEIIFSPQFDGECALHPDQQPDTKIAGGFTEMVEKKSGGSPFLGGEKTEPRRREVGWANNVRNE